MKIFRTFTELFERPQVLRYCVQCEKMFKPKAATDMFCRPACMKKYLKPEGEKIQIRYRLGGS